MNIEETKKAIKYLLASDITPLLWGHTGLGKSQIVEQYAKENGLDFIPLFMSQLEPQDFIGLYTIENGKTQNCQPNWLPSADNCNPKGGIVFLDEIGRASTDIRQAMYEFILNKKIHTYHLPKNYTIVTASNPADTYECEEFDNALINRFAHIQVKPTFNETSKYLKSKYGGGNRILNWVTSDKGLVDYGKEFNIDGMLLSPRMLENAAKIYNTIKGESATFMRKLLETMMVKEKAASFLAFLEELKHINYKEILAGEKKDKIKELVKDKRMDILSTLTNDLAEHFSTSKKANEEDMKNCTDFLIVVPKELDMAFLDNLKNYGSKNTIVDNPYFRKKMKDKLKDLKRLF